MAKPGRKPRPSRYKCSIALPYEHHARYLQEAKELNMSFSDYIASVLAQAHGYAEPEYIAKERERRTKLLTGQLDEKLPLDVAS